MMSEGSVQKKTPRLRLEIGGILWVIQAKNVVFRLRECFLDVGYVTVDGSEIRRELTSWGW